MKKLFLSTLLLTLPLLAGAYDIAVENDDEVTIYYNYMNDGTELEVTKGSYSGEVNIPKEVSYDGKTLPVTSIEKEAFKGCSGLTAVGIPSTITRIGVDAFYQTRGLESVHITDLEAWCNIDFVASLANPLYSAHHFFLNGEEIKDLVIPSSITSIKNYTFYGCDSLKSVTIPNTVTSIGEWAFNGCYRLNSVHITDLAAWCDIEFPTSGSNPLSNGGLFFLNGEEINDLVIPSSVTSIKDYAFFGCGGLTSVTIPNNVTNIGLAAFENCSQLATISFPNSVTTVDMYAFYGCYSLKSVHITDLAAWCNILFMNESSNPLYSARHLFMNDEEIMDLVIPNTVTSIGKYAFQNCYNMTSVTIPNSVTTIGDLAFGYCADMASLTIGNSVKSIGKQAFSCCNALPSVTIPNSVTTIGNNAFEFCNGLTSLTIGNSVTDIGNNAFEYCSSLTSVTSKMENPCPINEDCFYDQVYENATLYIPEGTIDNYTATNNWNKFVNKVEVESTVTSAKAVTESIPVEVSARDGILMVKGEQEGQPVAVYSIDGKALGSSKVKGGQAIIATNQPNGSIVVVKVGDRSVKVKM